MEELPLPPEEKKLPAPEEKFLRAPTFGEKYGKFRWLILSLLLFLIFVPVLILINKPTAPQQSTQLPTPTQPLLTSLPTPTADLTVNWKTYRNEKLGFEFKYSDFYQLTKETNSGVSFGQKTDDGFINTYLSISIDQITNYKSYKPCVYSDEDSINKQAFPCLENGSQWGQKEDIIVTMLGQVEAKSFYITEGFPDASYHIVQTTNSPKIEAKMLVSGGGLDSSFNQILSTFKFTQ